MKSMISSSRHSMLHELACPGVQCCAPPAAGFQTHSSSSPGRISSTILGQSTWPVFYASGPELSALTLSTLPLGDLLQNCNTVARQQLPLDLPACPKVVTCDLHVWPYSSHGQQNMKLSAQAGLEARPAQMQVLGIVQLVQYPMMS